MKAKGLGDTIKQITTWLGITQCEKCKERQVLLNKIFPYKNKEITMTNEQIEIIEELLSEEPTKVGCKILNDLRRQIDGEWTDSCFCSKTQRRAFYNTFREWYNSIEK